jgi:heat shock protein HtpX
MMIVAIVLAIIAPIIARLLYFATSRKREYLADATSARLTRFPAGLASALEKIAGSKIKFTAGNRAFAPMYITNPYEPGGLGVFNFASTHPPVYERIFILQNMAHGASYHDYQAAWRTIRKTSIAANLLPPSAVAMRESIPLRAPSEAEKADQRQRAKETGDLLRKLNNFMFIRCACGLTMKIPPEYSRESIVCPRCCLSNSVPVAEMAAVSAAGSSLSGISESPQVYKRKTKQWETFRCSCGHLLQLSPSFAAKEMTCPSCSKIIKME